MIKQKLKSTAFALALTLIGTTTVNAAQYTIKSGDSLYKISKTYDTTVSVLIKDNNLSSSMIYPGQVLNVPGNTHKVVNGDTLYLIAKKYNVSLYDLRTANNKWDNMIYTGQILNIPKSSSGSGESGSNVQATSGVIEYSSADVDLLARLITAEAGGENYDAQVAVGSIVVNRVQSSQFPNNIKGVIYDRSYGYYQFTPVANGMINKTATKSAINAAYAALKGADKTNGALYFYDNTATNKWLTSKTVAATMGNLIFAY